MASSANTPAVEASGFLYHSPTLEDEHPDRPRKSKDKNREKGPSRRQPRKSVVPEERIKYSKKAYKRDIVLLAELLKASDAGALYLPELDEPLTTGERGRINICYTLMSGKDLEAYREEFDLVLIDLVE